MRTCFATCTVWVVVVVFFIGRNSNSYIATYFAQVRT